MKTAEEWWHEIQRTGAHVAITTTVEIKAIQLDAERSGYERGVREARLNWSTGDVKPERGDFSSEYFLCVNLSGNPIVCVYDWETLDAFTIGGGDTQKVLWWTPLKSILSLLAKKEDAK